MCLNDANQPTANSELFKAFRKTENANCLLKLDKNTMLSQFNASQNSRQMIDNINNDFQPFAFIMTERFDNTQKINLTIISGMRVKKSVEKRQHKIKQTDHRLVFKETIKVENKKKKKKRVELKLTLEAILQ